jgi:hypothetical protein
LELPAEAVAVPTPLAAMVVILLFLEQVLVQMPWVEVAVDLGLESMVIAVVAVAVAQVIPQV